MKFNPKFPTLASTASIIAFVLAIHGILELRGVQHHKEFQQLDGWLMILLAVSLLFSVYVNRKKKPNHVDEKSKLRMQ